MYSKELLIDGCLFTRRVQIAEYLSQGSDDSDLTDCDCFRLDYTAMRFIPINL